MKIKNFLIAVLVTLLCSLLGKYLASFNALKLIGHLVLALLLGMIFQIFKLNDEKYHKSIGFISNKFLRLGIILLGFKLNIQILLASGIKSLVLATFVIIFTILVVYNIAKMFKVSDKLSLLCACGCGICGAAAVMGISGSIDADKDDTILSVAVVCILGTVFTLLIVLLKPIMNLTDIQYGVLSGASLHEIAHAVAAGAAGGTASLDIALITKLSRVLLLAPVAVIIGIVVNRKSSSEKEVRVVLPYFMLGFLVASLVGTYGKLDAKLLENLVTLAYIFLGMAMAALGLNVNFEVIKKRGRNIFIASFIGSLALFLSVLVIVKFIF